MEQEPGALSQNQAPPPPGEVSGAFVPPGEESGAFVPPAEQQANFAPDAVLSDGPMPTPAELVTRADLQPAAEVVAGEDTAAAGDPSVARATMYLKEATRLLGAAEKPEDDDKDPHTRAIDTIQAQFGQVRAQIEKHGEGPKHPEYVKAVIGQSEKLVKVLLSDEVQADPSKAELNRDGYELLANHFNRGKIPTFNELVGLRTIIAAKDPSTLLEYPNLSDQDKAKIQGYIDEVEEKSQAEYWALSADQRHWYERVAEIPSLKPYNAPVPAPRNVRQKLFDKANPKGSPQRKAFYKYISPPRHPDPKPKASPTSPPSKYFSKDEIGRVKREFWNNNPRQALNPHKNYNQNDKAVMAAARGESFARLQLDDSIRKAQDQFDSEVEAERGMAERAARYATIIGDLGRLGVRDQADQMIFEVADEYVRDYNENLLKRSKNKAVVAAGVKPVSSQPEKTLTSAAPKISFGDLRKPQN